MVKREKKNGVPPDLAYSNELLQKLKIFYKLILKKTFEVNNFSEILWHGYI